MVDCIFCKIINKEIPSELADQTDSLIVIKDINPRATIHYLIISKKHIVDIRSFEKDDLSLTGDIFAMAQKLSKKHEDIDFRVVSNNGKAAGQCVFHFHMHFLAGKIYSES